MKCHLACIILTKDNPVEIHLTLESVLAQRFSQNHTIHVVESWVDVKIVKEITDRFLPLFQKKCQNVVIHRIWPPCGIFASMNKSLEILKKKFSGTSELIFMNSGDRFLKPNSLDNLFIYKKQVEEKYGIVLPAVFGRAKIVASPSLSWMMPDEKIRNIVKWLRHFNPNHQSVLFDATWSYDNHYNLKNILVADRKVMKDAFLGYEDKVFVNQLISEFHLTGYSSKLPDWGEFKQRFNEPDRSFFSKIGEFTKFLIPQPFCFIYPYLMYIRSKFISCFF